MEDETWAQHGELCWPRSCSARNYDRFEPYNVDGARSRAPPIWRVLWRRIKKEKKRMFQCSNSSSMKFNYDPCSYSRNFDDQNSMWTDPDDVSRSFSASGKIPPE
ncbi:hypothetical protein C2S51_006705 [Perilla frutescens var. frutescens]|nr:hypothetical protein C2S51_006705 [Perilla frutescens var. frutescens]